MLGAVLVVLAATHGSTTIISDRITTLEHTGTTSDPSYRDRQAQTRVAADTFYANPIFGSGPGTLFDYTTAGHFQGSTFTPDTALDFPAKFGIAGLAVVGFLVLSYGSFLRSALRFNHPRTETLALIAYLAVTLVETLLQNPLEDKGFTFGLILLLALVFRTWLPAAPAPDGPAVVHTRHLTTCP
jgi:O-antigen ligase